MKWRRRSLIILAVVGLLVGGLLLAAHFYLRSAAAARRVASTLQQTLGVPVRVESVRLGLFGSSRVNGITVAESTGADPWLSIDELWANLSVLDVLRGRTENGKVLARGFRVRLCFNAGGTLTTVLPRPTTRGAGKALPALRLEDAQLTLLQQGRVPFTVGGIAADVRDAVAGWTLKGAIDDPVWGQWSGAGEFSPASSAASLTLQTDWVTLAPGPLRMVPFVPPRVWDQVEVEGPARATVRLALGGEKGFGFRVEASPLEATIRVRAPGLEITRTTGSVVVDGGNVTLRTIHGLSAGGVIQGDGDLDFRSAIPRLDLNAKIRAADLQTFTRTWGLPQQLRQIAGRLSGSARIVLSVGKQLRIDGTGEGQIDDARLAGEFPVRGPVRFRLYSVGGKAQVKADLPFAKPRLSRLLTPLTRRAPSEEEAERVLPQIQANAVSHHPGSPSDQGVDTPRSPAIAPPLAAGVPRTGTPLFAAVPGGAARQGKSLTTLIEVSCQLEDVDLAGLLQRLSIELPLPLGGRSSFSVKVALPLNAPGDLAAYHLTGRIRLERLQLARLELDSLETGVTLDHGVLHLEGLRGVVHGETGPGRIEGTASLQLAPLGDLRTALALNDVPLACAAILAPGLTGKLTGSFGATVTACAPACRLQDVEAWEGSAAARAEKLTALGTPVERISANLRLTKGAVTLTQFKVESTGVEAAGTATLHLRTHLPFEVRLASGRADLATLRGLPAGLAGQLSATGAAQGTLEPFVLAGNGSLDGKAVWVKGVALDEVHADWIADDSRVSLERIRVLLRGGRLSGKAVLPLRAAQVGRVELKLTGLDLAALADDLKELPLRLAGELSGTLDGELSEEQGGEREFGARVEVTSPRIRVQDIPAERLRGHVAYRRGTMRYHLEGDALEGRFEIDGRQTPLVQQKANTPRAPFETTIRIRRAYLGRLIRTLGRTDAPPSLRGQIDLTLTLCPDEKGVLSGSGELQLTRLQWDRVDLAQRLSGGIRLRGPILELPEFGGEAMGGLARVRLFLHLRQPERSWMTANLDRVEGEKLLAFFPGAGTLVEGPVDVSLRALLGREWRGSGQVVLTRGKFGGVEVAEWRLPYRVSFSPTWGSGQIDIADSSAQPAMGRAVMQASLGWGTGMRLEGQVRFTGLEFRSLARPLVEYEKQLGNGRVSGRLDFSGRDLRSLADLNARLDLDFQQAQPLEMPVFRAVLPYLRGVSVATTVDSGELRATLGKGVWRVQRLTLENRILRLLAEGTLTLQGHLDLEVTARTGELVVSPAALRILGLSLGQPVSIEVLARATQFLSNRVVHLRVEGMVRNPAVRVEPVALFTEEVIRFFLPRASFSGQPSRPGL